MFSFINPLKHWKAKLRGYKIRALVRNGPKVSKAKSRLVANNNVLLSVLKHYSGQSCRD